MSLPFTSEQFFDVFARYNGTLWPFAVALWIYAAATALVVLVRPGSSRAATVMLSVQWLWAGVAYHAAYFSRINPAAWLFGAMFVIHAGLLLTTLVWRPLTFSSSSRRTVPHLFGVLLVVYSLLYPAIVFVEGHQFPRAPTFGVPCPTTLLTAGFLFIADRPWPRGVAVIPILWASLAGSAAVALDVRADLMLWVAAVALAIRSVVPAVSADNWSDRSVRFHDDAAPRPGP